MHVFILYILIRSTLLYYYTQMSNAFLCHNQHDLAALVKMAFAGKHFPNISMCVQNKQGVIPQLILIFVKFSYRRRLIVVNIYAPSCAMNVVLK